MPSSQSSRRITAPGGVVHALILGLMLIVATGCDKAEAKEVAGGLAGSLVDQAKDALPALPMGPPALPADSKLNRGAKSRFRSTVGGHILYVPKGFSAPDGAFDLLVAFHTHRPVLFESIEQSGLNAVVANVNLGTGAGNYEKVFSDPLAFEKLLENVIPEIEGRGLDRPRIRRIGLLSWSAGFGAVRGILGQRHMKRIDFAAVLDGLHVHVFPNSDEIVVAEVDAYEGFARKALAGDAAFIITHNHIVPDGMPIASVTRTTNLLLDRLGLERRPASGEVVPPHLTANDGVYSKKRTFTLTAETIVEEGGFVVRGYAGREKEDHVCHLMGMRPLALEPLKRRWEAPETIAGATF